MGWTICVCSWVSLLVVLMSIHICAEVSEFLCFRHGRRLMCSVRREWRCDILLSQLLMIMPQHMSQLILILIWACWFLWCFTWFSVLKIFSAGPFSTNVLHGSSTFLVHDTLTYSIDTAIERPVWYRLYPGEATPCVYGLPKIYKEGTPLRPICSSINLVTYNIARHLFFIRAPLMWNTLHQIQNFIAFAN